MYNLNVWQEAIPYQSYLRAITRIGGSYFTQVVILFCEEGLLSLKDLYTDGTKIEANANRYTFVWGNAIKHNKEKIRHQLNDPWQYAESVAASELDDTDPSGFDKITSQRVT